MYLNLERYLTIKILSLITSLFSYLIIIKKNQAAFISHPGESLHGKMEWVGINDSDSMGF